MSLVQHVSAVEGLDREFEEEIDALSLLGLTRTESRPDLSYDPLPTTIIGEKCETAGAYEVPTWKRACKFAVDVGVVKLTISSAGLRRCHELHCGIWCCVWVRSTENCARGGRCIQAMVSKRRAQSRCQSMLLARSMVRELEHLFDRL